MGLCIQGVSKRFGSFTAVDHLSIEVPRGSVFGFLGSNGAGKTTTIRMVLGLLVPDEGVITWDGRPIDAATRRRVGYLPEERGLYPRMRVLDQMVYLGRLKGMDPFSAGKAADYWLQWLGIEEYAKKRTDQLSKGNQQKVQFAVAAMNEPELLILDEPFSGLDPVGAQVLREALAFLHRMGTTILFSSHQMEMVEALCKHVALIHRSHLVMSGELREIKRQSRKQLVRLAMEGDTDFLTAFPAVAVKHRADYLELTWQGDLDPQAVLEAAMQHGRVVRWELGEPSLTDIYLQKVGEARA